VLYDRHGCGLSSRNRTSFTAEDDLADLDAVIAALGAERIDLFGISTGGFISVRFAADRPERVGHLILWGTGALYDHTKFPPEVEKRSRALNDLRESDLDAYMRAMATQMFPDGIAPDTFRDFVRLNLETASVEMQASLETVVFDNRELLTRVQAPTLVLHRKRDQMVPLIAGQYLAKHIPAARFVALEGGEHLPFFGDIEPGLHAIVDFITEGEHSGATATTQAAIPQSGTAIILFTDIADSTTLTERLGDAAFRDHARSLDDVLRTIITTNGGSPIEGKLLGDGVLATFPAASQAIAAARACEQACANTPLKLHLGIHAGDVIRESNNVFGGAVNIASRICALSAPGEILVSATVRDLARTSASVSFEDRGPHDLKGIADPVHLFAVRPAPL
jgi:class 3 adenylate cyclase/esterase/lipase